VTGELGGVPQTLLWTLYHRSVEARRPDAILVDPRAVALVDEDVVRDDVWLRRRWRQRRWR
jgi:O-methyltransferase involved in polyketide biosynthesis